VSLADNSQARPTAQRTLRPAPSKNPPTAAPAEPVRKPRRAPLAESDEAAPRRSWEERLGPVGIVVLTVIACLLAYLLTRGLF
jgi:hypothetical protein